MGTWSSAILIFFAVALGIFSLGIAGEWLRLRRRQRRIKKQLERLSAEDLETAVQGAGKLFRGGSNQDPGGRTGLPVLRDLEHRLQQSALGWSVKRFVLLTCGFAFAAGLAVLLATSNVLFALGAMLLFAPLPYVYVNWRRKKRLDSFEEQFPETVDLLGRAIRAGHPLSSGLKMVSEETSDPIAGEFRQVFEEQRFGLPFDDSITALADRIPLTDVRIFVTALLVQREVGGNLAEILDNLSSIIRQRFTLRRQVRVLTAEGRLSGYVLTVLPIAIGLWVLMSNPAYIMLLFEHPVGKVMVAGAAMMQVVGFFWMRRITNVEF